jgi:hypothetical protein
MELKSVDPRPSPDIRLLQEEEVNAVSGGNPALGVAIIAGLAAIGMILAARSPTPFDGGGSGRGDDNGCTGFKC